ncbi:DUF6337 family protein [Prolixibacter bellariivorans]|uniref:DUF6337 family protein n=1 Tax=Prolixibacter bellariivorans TaxID=314319 RepID=UPI00055D5072|nr:DUF6337 family protein [Prolixibacter bellariivorans]
MHQSVSDNFQAAFGGGISGHTLMASRFFFIALIVKYKKKYNIPLLILLFFFISYGVKGWIFIPIISGLFVRIILRKTTLSIWFITKLLLSSFLLFYTVYRIAIGPQMPIKFVFTHFMTYIFSGPLGLSEYLKQNNEIGFDPGVIVNPLINIYNHFLGDGELYNYKNIMTNIGGDISTNTKTFFGTIYIYSGSFWGIIYTLIFGAMTYSFLIISLKTKDLIFLVIYGTFLTMLFFAWFDSYTGNLFFYEFPTFGILLYLTYNTLRKKNNPIMQHT